MPIYIKTVSFTTEWGGFNSKKDDKKVNAALDELRRQGKILSVEVSVGGSFWTGVVATYLITYETPGPIR